MKKALIESCSLERSILYRLLSIALRYPYPTIREELLPLIDGALQSAEHLFGPESELIKHLNKLLSEVGQASVEELESQYVGAMGHTVRTTCPAYESEYGELRGSNHVVLELSDLSAFYKAFELKVGEKGRERSDHVAVECEYMHFLTFKQSYAEEEENKELVECCIGAQQKFLKAHLGRWSPSFFRRLRETADGGIYQCIASVGLAIIIADCHELGVTSGSEQLQLRICHETRDDSFDCSVPTDCPGSSPKSDANSGGGHSVLEV